MLFAYQTIEQCIPRAGVFPPSFLLRKGKGWALMPARVGAQLPGRISHSFDLSATWREDDGGWDHVLTELLSQGYLLPSL